MSNKELVLRAIRGEAIRANSCRILAPLCDQEEKNWSKHPAVLKKFKAQPI
jgi:hypothetical protein